MKRSLFAIVALLVVFSLVLAACGATSEPAPEPTEAPAPEATEAPAPEPTTAEEVAQRLGQTPAAVVAELMTLVLEGHVLQQPGGGFRRVRGPAGSRREVP